ncbi:MAG TPA: hypothetical protein VK968_04135, partial [Roseimicrobium sp.]|nr:hypothetical protein [Roseimicrobium sp.]
MEAWTHGWLISALWGPLAFFKVFPDQKIEAILCLSLVVTLLVFAIRKRGKVGIILTAIASFF